MVFLGYITVDVRAFSSCIKIPTCNGGSLRDFSSISYKNFARRYPEKKRSSETGQLTQKANSLATTAVVAKSTHIEGR